MSLKNSKPALQHTGERIVTSINEYWALEHLHRYALVKELAAGKCVLDIASGEGYGSNLLADAALSVVGIDISKEAVDHAREKYKKQNLRYEYGSATQMNVPDSSVDVLVSFETIEHHDQHEEMMLEIKRVLKDDGIVVISSPDKRTYSDIPNYKNPFHVKELYTHEFESLMKKHFEHTLMLYQKSCVASIISSNTQNNSAFKEYNGTFEKVSEHEKIQNAVYNICIASAVPLPCQKINFESFFSNEALNKFYFELLTNYSVVKSQNDILLNKVNSSSYKLGRLVSYPYRMVKGMFKST
jgi:ubiquinone/menaquinone biosynthesis C-methylase UbiE